MSGAGLLDRLVGLRRKKRKPKAEELPRRVARQREKDERLVQKAKGRAARRDRIVKGPKRRTLEQRLGMLPASTPKPDTRVSGSQVRPTDEVLLGGEWQRRSDVSGLVPHAKYRVRWTSTMQGSRVEPGDEVMVWGAWHRVDEILPGPNDFQRGARVAPPGHEGRGGSLTTLYRDIDYEVRRET